jgi:hypothetical protein
MIKPNKHKALILKWADGAEIQRYQSVDDRWIACENPTWRPEYVYRVKPVPCADIKVGVQAFVDFTTIVRPTPLGECSNLQLIFDGETHLLKSAIVR